MISGNNNGVVILNAGATGNLVQGNFIGTATDGVTTWATRSTASSSPTPRGTRSAAPRPGAGNVISGNNRGVEITGAGALGDQVQGNFIGTDLTAPGQHRQQDRRRARSPPAPRTTTVGGTDPGAGNTIAYNVGDGVLVDATGGVDNAILSNSIFSNHGLGIDLGGDGVTPNHPGGSTHGPEQPGELSRS